MKIVQIQALKNILGMKLGEKKDKRSLSLSRVPYD